MAIDLWRTHPSMPSFSGAIDRLFEQALAQSSGGTPHGGTEIQSIPVNVWETEEGYQAALLVPGLEESSLNVTVHEDTLAIEGQLHFAAPEGAKMVWQEFGPTEFRRSLRLVSAVEPTKVEAVYKNGLLQVTMPKAEHAKPRQIQVQLGESAAPPIGEAAPPTKK